MAARKVSQKKQALIDAEFARRARRRRRWLAALCLALLVGGITWQADQWLDVHVKKIQIEGELSSGERDAVTEIIAQAITSSGGTGLHSLSLEEVRAAVAGLSWADRVSARRRWPDTLVVRLTRHSVVARWGGGGFVATNGQVIVPASGKQERAADLPLLNCKQANSGRAMEVFSLLNGTLKQTGLRLVELTESELGEWSAGVTTTSASASASGGGDQITVALGRDDLVERLQRFLAVRDETLKEDLPKIAAVDARYHNGVAVRWHESPVPAVATERLAN